MFPLIIGLGLAAYQTYQGAKDKKKAENQLNDYERQTLSNAYENIQISTVGSDLMTQESQRTTANLTDATRNAGLRGVLGGIPKIQAQNNLANQEARKYLDDQVNKRQYAMAEDETDLRRFKESRDISNIGALSSQVNAGKQDMWNGINGMYQAGSAIYNQSVANASENQDNDGGNMVNMGTNSNSNPSIYGPNNFSAPPSIVSKSFYETNGSILNNYSTPKF